MQQAANEDTLSLDPVETVSLLEGARRIQRSNEGSKADELWLGRGISPGGVKVEVYFRIAHRRAVTAELVFSVIARALGLPVPRPYLVEVSPSQLRQSLLAKTIGQHLTFGCANAQGMTFTQLLADNPNAQALLQRWQGAVHTAAMDDWLLNTDRNGGNIIYSNKSFWLIDHAEAFGGSQAELWGLGEAALSECTPNIMLDLLRKGATRSDQGVLLQKASQWVRSWQSTVLQSIPLWIEEARLESVESPFPAEQILKFASQRLCHLESDLCKKLIGQSPLPATTPS